MMSPRGPTRQWSHDNPVGQVRELVPEKVPGPVFTRNSHSGNAPLAYKNACLVVKSCVLFFCEFP